jgi:type III secretion protein S
MTPQHILDLTTEGLLIVLWVGLPTVVVSTVTSLLISVVQAVTQIQDQSIGQSIRLVAVLLTLLICSAWQGREVLHFAERALQSIRTIS